MAEVAKLIITADGKQAVKVLDEINGKINDTGKATQKSGVFFDNLKKHWIALAAAGVGIMVYFNQIIKAAAEQEEADKKLAQSLRLVGQYSDSTFNSLKNFASQLATITVYGDETIQMAMQFGLQLGISAGNIENATQSAIGLSSVLGVDLQSAMRMVAQAGEGNYAMLGRYIPELKNVTTESEKQAIANRFLANTYKMALTEGDTFSGKMKILNNTFGELKENLGNLFLPIATKIVEWLKDVITWINEAPSRVKILQAALMGIAAAFIAINIASGGWLIITGIIVGALVAASVLIIDNWERVKVFFSNLWSYIKIGMLESLGIIIEGLALILNPLILVVDNIINAINSMTGKHIEGIEAMKVASQEWIDTQVLFAEQEIATTNNKYTKLISDEQLAAQKRKKIQDDLNKSRLKGEGDTDKQIILWKEDLKKYYGTWYSFIQGAQNSHIKAVWVVWKAAAVAEAIVNTYSAAIAGFRAMVGIPIVGVVLAPIAAAAAIAFGLEQVHRILATPPPAEKGGIVMGSSAGTVLTVGEKGKSEAIIPLEDSNVMANMGETHLHLHIENLYGGSDIPSETIKAIDRGFYKLKQDKTSLVFA